LRTKEQRLQSKFLYSNKTHFQASWKKIVLRLVGKDPLLIEEPKQTISNTNIIFFPLDVVQKGKKENWKIKQTFCTEILQVKCRISYMLSKANLPDCYDITACLLSIAHSTMASMEASPASLCFLLFLPVSWDANIHTNHSFIQNQE